MNTTATHERPCAAPGLTSYRYAGLYGPIMIGAKNHTDALREADRSLSSNCRATLERLEVWDGARYVPATIPPVLDQAADPLGYNRDKLRTIAGALALKKGGKGLSRDCTRALLRALAAIQDGASPEGARFCIQHVTTACRRAPSEVRHLAAQAIQALESLEALVRAVPARWFPGKPATLSGAAQQIRRDWTASARLGLTAPPGVYVADVQRLLADGREAWSFWTDGKVCLFVAALPALVKAVAAQPASPGVTSTIAKCRAGIGTVSRSDVAATYGAPWTGSTPGALARDGDAVAFFAAHNVAILKAHGGTVWRLASRRDMGSPGMGCDARDVLAAWNDKGEPVGFAMSISLGGKEAAAAVVAAALAVAVWGPL